MKGMDRARTRAAGQFASAFVNWMPCGARVVQLFKSGGTPRVCEGRGNVGIVADSMPIAKPLGVPALSQCEQLIGPECCAVELPISS